MLKTCIIWSCYKFEHKLMYECYMYCMHGNGDNNIEFWQEVQKMRKRKYFTIFLCIFYIFFLCHSVHAHMIFWQCLFQTAQCLCHTIAVLFIQCMDGQNMLRLCMDDVMRNFFPKNFEKKFFTNFPKKFVQKI